MRRLALALLLLTLTACGAATPATDGDSTGAASPAAQSPAASAAPSLAAQPSEAALPAETSTSIGTIGGGGNAGAGDEVERQAQATLARQLNVAPETLVLQNKEETEWSDGSLGCAVPDMMYAQVITPGYKLTYTNGGQTYELHTNQNGSQVVWCENGRPREIAQP